MNERLWSPQMRKWAADAHRHGIDIGLTKHRPSRQDWAGGLGQAQTGTPNYVNDRFGVNVVTRAGDYVVDVSLRGGPL